jgi:hypothetical protein
MGQKYAEDHPKETEGVKVSRAKKSAKGYKKFPKGRKKRYSESLVRCPPL